MALMEMTFRSEALNSDQTITVILPEPKDLKLAEAGKPSTEDLPVLYLLHGHTDNHTAWLRRSNMDFYLHKSDRNMLIVCPGMQNFWYTDMANGWAYYTYMAVELPAFIQSVFRVSQKREDTYIAGLSMGGYGAFKIALNNPDKYAAAASFSGGLDICGIKPSDKPGDVTAKECMAVFGVDDLTKLKGTEYDLYQVFRDAKASGAKLPKLYQSCGTADFLYQDNLKFRDFLKDEGIACEYYEEEGKEHEWDFWDSEGKKLIEWLPMQNG